MSKFNPRIVFPLAVCLFTLILSVTLATAQRDDQPPDPTPSPTPDIDWSTIKLPPHDPPLVAERTIPESAENAPSDEPAIITDEGTIPEPAESAPPEEPAIVTDEGTIPEPAESVLPETSVNLTDGNNKTYTVKSGDSLYRIARRFGVSHITLASYNNLINPRLIYPGQTLRIPLTDTLPSPPNPDPPPSPPNPSPPPSPPNPDPPPASGNTYTVKPGDSLYRIARRFGVTVQALAATNDITNPRRIYPGTILKIPDSSDVPPLPAPTPTPPPSSTPPPPVDGQSTYVVQPGDSLYLIARRFDVTVEALAIVNQLNNWWRIYPGQVLVIPSPTDPLPTPTPIPDDTPYIWPVDSRSIVNGYKAGHRAIDIVVPTDTPVLAIADGVVEFAGWNIYGYGYLVVVDHGNGVRSLYAHHDSLVVTTGQTVTQGETLGLSGNTGNSTMPHLHLEIRINGNVNPCLHLPGGC